MTLGEWREKYIKMMQMADRIHEMRLKRWKRMVAEAGLDPNYAGIHLNNALVSLHYGQPWKGVDYDKVKYARWFEYNKLFEPYRVVERWDKRVYPQVIAEMVRKA